MSRKDEVKQHVRDYYSKLAEESCSCTPCCGSAEDAVKQAKAIGYTEEELRSVPPEALLGVGCGNPTALAGLREGEVVLDLGSGAGIDVFLASKRVGRTGKVIGVDMTREMIDRANENARSYGYQNVEFKTGEIDDLPLEDNTIDVVISNCVVNLTTDKPATFKETHRVLKRGGRFLISDLVTDGELPDDVRESFDAWACCIAGAMPKQAYLDTIAEAGFRDVKVVAETVYDKGTNDDRLKGKIISVQVEAFKR